MFKLAIFFTLVAICVAHPGLLGLGGHGGLGLGIAAPAVVAAPLAVSSGISHQSRVDIRTPVVAVAAAPVAVAAAPIAVGHGLGFGGVALGGLGLGHGALGLGHGALGLGLSLGHGK